MVNELKRRVDIPESSNSAKHARSDDIDQRGWGLEPKHNIFLSHSGKQKDFTERLWEELRRVHYFPFFDKCPDSLLKGDEFPPAIIQAARQCHVAILVLSEEFFTRSRWPMIELNEFVKAQASINSNLKILPLFFKISVEEFKDVERRKRWQKIWEGWVDEGIKNNKTHKLEVADLIHALSEVEKKNGMEFVEEIGERTYIANVVGAVCNLVPAYVKYDVSHVQSLPRLCKAIFEKFDESREVHPKYEVQVVGLFGMGGVGKTTISKAMCNESFGEFVGKVCHVELGGKSLVELRKKVLQDLTRASEMNLPHDLDKLKTLLSNRMQDQKVFLCLDNIWHGDIEEVKMYLKLHYQVDSKVLVTSRSCEVLKSLGLKDCNCIEMPELYKNDAIELFLHYADISCVESRNNMEWDIINRCVQACVFAKQQVSGLGDVSESHHYLPLALKVWGIQLGQISGNPLEWKESLEDLRNHKFNYFSEEKHPLFSLLRQGYDSLKPKEQHLFLDLALFVTPATEYGSMEGLDIAKWLKCVYMCERDSLVRSLAAIRRKALLDFAMNEDILELQIHDLYIEFAMEEVQALDSSYGKSRILYVLEGSGLLSKLHREEKCRDLERMRIFSSLVKSIKKDDLLYCTNVEVLQVVGWEELVELDVQAMHGLRSLDVARCYSLGDKFMGVNKLMDLVWLRLDIGNPPPFLKDLSLMTTLEFLELYAFGESRKNLLLPPNLSECCNLQELIMSIFCNLESLPNLTNLTTLEKIVFKENGMVQTVIGLSSLINLKVLDLWGCRSLIEIPGLYNLVALEILDVGSTQVSELSGIGKLQHLEKLCVDFCSNLTSLVELEYVTSLRHLEAKGCNELKEVPIDNLKELEVVDLRWSGICVVPSDFGRLAKGRILKLEGCVELFEPLVVWLWEQELLLMELPNAYISTGLSFEEQIKGQFWNNIRKDVAFYMDEILYYIDDDQKLLHSHDLLAEKKGGIEFAIKVLCNHEDMGILSMVIAKYAAKGEYWEELIAESTIGQLYLRIVEFLNQQFDQLYDELKNSHWTRSRCVGWCMKFIVDRVINNPIMAWLLESPEIQSFADRYLETFEQEKFF